MKLTFASDAYFTIPEQVTCRADDEMKRFATTFRSRGLLTRSSTISSELKHSDLAESRVEYAYVAEAENIDNYRPGGYHPVRIDERLKRRYRIVHKLGYGSFSTVWLAIDEGTSKYVAVKVGSADAGSTEPNILRYLNNDLAVNGHLARKLALIPKTYDQFNVQGPNGVHTCVVGLAGRCSLSDSREASGSGLFQLDVARSLAAQLTLAVSLVHAAGYAHGDLHLGNLLLQLPSTLENLPLERLYAAYGEPELEPVVLLGAQEVPKSPGIPPYVVPSIWLGVPSPELLLSEAKLILTDFGVAFCPHEKSRFESHTPQVIRPPEALFEPAKALTFASDVWSLGCVIFELLGHRSLIDGFLCPEDEIICQQIELQGRLPIEWWFKWEERSKWYDEAGNALRAEGDRWSWDRRFEQWLQEPRRRKQMGIMSGEEKEAFLDLLRAMLAWKPENRPDVDAVIKSRWMRQWALPACQKTFDVKIDI